MTAILYLFLLFFNSEQPEYFRNEPVVLSFSISTDSVKIEQLLQYQKDYLLFQKNIGKITEEEYKAKEAETFQQQPIYAIEDSTNWRNKVEVERYNASTKIWSLLTENVFWLDIREEPESILLEKNQYFTSNYGIDPETIEKMEPGEYQFRARCIATNRSENRSDTTYTEPVRICIDKSLKTMKDPMYLKKLCIYFLRRNLPSKAMEYAKMYGDLNEGSFESILLFGEVYEALGNYDNALDHYLRAKTMTKGMPHQYDEFLGDKIQQIIRVSPESFQKLIKEVVE